MSKETIINNLREMANYLESRNLILDETLDIFMSGTIYLPCKTIPSFKQNIKVMGSFEKSAGSALEANKRIGELYFQVYIERSKVCKRVVTGTKTVPAVSAVPAHEEDVVEYKCPKSFHDIPDNMEETVKA